jgi:predicted ATPase/class 3 adenylate cyclase
MDTPVALLLTDLVDSAALSERLGDTAMAAIWATHDRMARDLLRTWNGREIDKTDGFLLLFDQARDALGYVLGYHQALASIDLPLQDSEGRPLRLSARAGLHVGQITVRENPAADVALGAKRFEADGVSKPIAARVMSTALGGQTLITAAARDALGAIAQRIVSHGHWRVKGIPAPLELFEVGNAGAPFTPPPDAPKVYRVLRKGEVWLPVHEVRHSLPAERDSFVGRRGTLQELARRFDGEARHVSLLGVGGCGKTRLATRFGWSWLGDYPGGVWFCDLAPARTLEGVVYAVAQGLEVPLGLEDPVVQLGHAIAGRGRCLLILDNFEQVARHAEDTLGRWLERAPDVHFLVTTREVLGISGEQVVALAPLPYDEAERLFLRRAAAARRDWAPSEEDQDAVGPLVRLLDGLPLAIELAAARVRMLMPRALLARMSERFKLLTSSGGRLDRQATLRATFDWSWDLLRPTEKAALAQLSVFEGGFTLEAAEAVLDLEGLDDSAWAMDVVNSLVDKSFVRPLSAERFDLLVTMQAYAAEHLCTEGRYAGSGPAAQRAAQRRHSAWFAALGALRAVAGRGADLDNLAIACRRAAADGDAAVAADALDGAWAALSLVGPFKAGIELAEVVLALPGAQGVPAAHAQAVLGWALEASGQPERAAAQYERALHHAQSCGDLACEAMCTIRLSGIQARAGRAAEAQAALSSAREMAQRLGDVSLQCAALNGAGTVDFERGQMTQAREPYEAALALARQAGDRPWQARLLGNLGNLHANLGDLARAHSHCLEALAMLRILGDRQREGNQLSNLGMLHLLRGELEEACTACESALVIARELGYPRLEFTVLDNLGQIYVGLQRLEQAQACCEGALPVARRIGNRRGEGLVLSQLGLVLVLREAYDRARPLLTEGVGILRAVADGLSLGLALCRLAECERLAGQPQAARTAFAEATTLAAESRAGKDSELGRALTRLEASLG